MEAGLRHLLAPSGVTLAELRAEPAGVRVPLATRHRKYAEPDDDAPRGFRTPSRKVELHPDTARQRDITAGDWVRVETPYGSVRARSALDATLDPAVVCGQHGW